MCLDRQDADFVNENTILTPHERTRGDADADPEDGEASLDTCWDRNVPFRVCPSRPPSRQTLIISSSVPFIQCRQPRQVRPQLLVRREGQERAQLDGQH